MKRIVGRLLFAFAVPAALWAQPADAVITLAGSPPQTIARFASGRWTNATDPLRCAAPGSAERIEASGGAVASPARRMTSAGAEWKTLEPAIVRLVEQRQREHRLAAGNLSAVPVHIDAVYAAGASAERSVYYFEASRRVPDPGTAPEEDPKGTLRVTVSGWLLRQGSAVTTIGSKSELGWDQDSADGTAVDRPDLVPLAVIEHDSQSVWVMKGGIGDIRWLALYRVDGVRVQTLIDELRCVR